MKKIRYFFEGLFLLLIFGISKSLPLDWASGFGGWIGRTLGPRLAASRKATRNLEKIYPDISVEKQKEIVTGMWDNLGRVMMEYPHLKKIGRNRTKIENIETLKSYKGKPVIFISAHMGNWECCPPAFAMQLDYISHAVYRAPNNPISDWLLNKARCVDKRMYAIPKSKSGMRQIVENLKSNIGIGMLIDQKFNEGMETNFMGHPAMTFSAFAQLSQKFDCPLIPLKLERLKGANFKITTLPPLSIKDKTTEEIIGTANKLLENWINEKPDQWLWLHKRWKD